MNNFLKFDFDDVNLIPKYCIVDSRSECNTSVKFGKHTFNLPVIPANMESVINEDLCIKLAQYNYFYIMHRFGTDNVKFIKKMKSLNLYTSISIGVNDDSYFLLNELINKNLVPDYITIDIAHGHSLKMKNMLDYLKQYFHDTFIIAGNVCTEEGVEDLDRWGANSIKLGLANGSVCTTSDTTGFGSRNSQASIINRCVPVTNKPIISDGGIKNPGDIAKAIVLGSSMVMCGSILSAFRDSPGILVEKEGVLYKSYHGSASSLQSNKKNHIEGTNKLIKLSNMTLIDYLEYLKECLQSSISYGGGNKLYDLWNVDFINI